MFIHTFYGNKYIYSVIILKLNNHFIIIVFIEMTKLTKIKNLKVNINKPIGILNKYYIDKPSLQSLSN